MTHFQMENLKSHFQAEKSETGQFQFAGVLSGKFPKLWFSCETGSPQAFSAEVKSPVAEKAKQLSCGTWIPLNGSCIPAPFPAASQNAHSNATPERLSGTGCRRNCEVCCRKDLGFACMGTVSRIQSLNSATNFVPDIQSLEMHCLIKWAGLACSPPFSAFSCEGGDAVGHTPQKHKGIFVPMRPFPSTFPAGSSLCIASHLQQKKFYVGLQCGARRLLYRKTSPAGKNTGFCHYYL
uniref:Uncharacterized protein n=1 Tax=Sphaerodactylus townsendi TaxID=933632 RepID=A0ACB8ENQ8_9SAUR